MSLTYSRRAKQDLARILSYCEKRNPSVADRLAAELETSIQLIGSYPLAGRARPKLGAALRTFPCGLHLLIYRTDGENAVLLRVIDGRRDIESEIDR